MSEKKGKKKKKKKKYFDGSSQNVAVVRESSCKGRPVVKDELGLSVRAFH